MKKQRNIFNTIMLPVLFIWYIGGISLFPHTHIINGAAVVHSHPFPDTNHQSEENILTIDLLCNFTSDAHPDGVIIPEATVLPSFQETESHTSAVLLRQFHQTFYLRGPPQL